MPQHHWLALSRNISADTIAKCSNNFTDNPTNQKLQSKHTAHKCMPISYHPLTGWQSRASLSKPPITFGRRVAYRHMVLYQAQAHTYNIIWTIPWFRHRIIQHWFCWWFHSILRMFLSLHSSLSSFSSSLGSFWMFIVHVRFRSTSCFYHNCLGYLSFFIVYVCS